MSRESRQRLLDALLVANVDKDAAEDAGTTRSFQWDEHAALQHVLQESHGLQTHRLSSGIGTRYDEYALLSGELDVERYHLLAMLGQCDA